MDHCPPGSSVHGISQAKILEWVAIPFSRVSSWAGDQARISFTGRQILYHWSTWEAQFAKCIERLGIIVLFIFFLFCRIRKYLYNLQVNRVSCILFFFFFNVILKHFPKRDIPGNGLLEGLGGFVFRGVGQPRCSASVMGCSLEVSVLWFTFYLVHLIACRDQPVFS